jgi:methyl-accepting chemotaxis protein
LLITDYLLQKMTNEASLFWILVIIAVCFAVIAISILIIAFMVLRVVGIVREFQHKIEPLLTSVNNISAQGKEIAEKFGEMSGHLSVATRNFSESAALIKEEVAELKVLVGQTAVTTKDKLVLVSKTIDRTNEQVRETTDFIQMKIVEPARELAAIMAGFRKGLEVLLAPRPKQLDAVYGDDEMFIG